MWCATQILDFMKIRNCENPDILILIEMESNLEMWNTFLLFYILLK